MASKKSKAVAAAGKKPGTALATMKDLEAFYAAEAAQAAAGAQVSEGVPRISAKDGVFWVKDQELPDPLEVIVVAEAHLNVWYEEAYDPENPSPPGCFALAPVLELNVDGTPKPGTGEEALHAHPTSPKIQGGANEHDCASCELNKFGSADVGKGKACGNTRQLAVVMANDPALTDPTSELRYAMLSLSPTSLTPWAKFVQGLNKIEKRPPHGAVIRFSFNRKDPVESKRKAVVAVGYQLITDPVVAVRIRDLRRELIEGKVLLRPLPTEVREPEKKGKGKGGAAKKGKEPKRAARF